MRLVVVGSREPIASEPGSAQAVPWDGDAVLAGHVRGDVERIGASHYVSSFLMVWFLGSHWHLPVAL